MMKSLHLKKLAGVGEKMRTWGKASEDEPQQQHRRGHRRRHSHGHERRSESPPPPPTPAQQQQHEELPFSDEGDDPGVLSPASSGNEEDLHVTREALTSSGSSHTSSTSSTVSLLDDMPLLPALPPLPPNARRRGSLDSSSDALLIDIGDPPQHVHPQRQHHQHQHLHQQHQHHHHHQPHLQPPSPVATGAAHGDNKGHKTEDRIKALKLREMALRDERNQERQRRKEAERQLKAMQKERYIQGLKIKYLETKLEKFEKKDGSKSDMERRIKKEAQVNIALQKEIDALRAKLVEKDKALAEKEDVVAKAKSRYSRLKHGGTDECSLQALEELDRQLEKSRNALLERIKLRLKEEADDKAKCAICYDRTKAIIFVPCGHRVCCTQCGNQVKTCPICRANIDIRQKVFD